MYMYMYMFMYMHIFCTCTCTCTCILYLYTYVCVCMYVCIYIHIYMYVSWIGKRSLIMMMFLGFVSLDDATWKHLQPPCCSRCCCKAMNIIAIVPVGPQAWEAGNWIQWVLCKGFCVSKSQLLLHDSFCYKAKIAPTRLIRQTSIFQHLCPNRGHHPVAVVAK